MSSEAIIVVSEESFEVISEAIQGPRGPAGPSGSNIIVVGEVPAGSINGSNATFTAAFPFVPESVNVTVNGLRQKKVDDFNTSGTQQIIMLVSPETGTHLQVDYLRA